MDNIYLVIGQSSIHVFLNNQSWSLSTKNDDEVDEADDDEDELGEENDDEVEVDEENDDEVEVDEDDDEVDEDNEDECSTSKLLHSPSRPREQETTPGSEVASSDCVFVLYFYLYLYLYPLIVFIVILCCIEYL